MAKVKPSLEDENEIPLLRADQDMINEFARLNSRKQRFQAALKRLQTEYEGIEDASNEVLMLEEEDDVNVQIGECFFALSNEDAQTKLEALQEEKQKEVDAKKKEIGALDKRMGELKAQLYAKFGSTINLEA